MRVRSLSFCDEWWCSLIPDIALRGKDFLFWCAQHNCLRLKKPDVDWGELGDLNTESSPSMGMMVKFPVLARPLLGSIHWNARTQKTAVANEIRVLPDRLLLHHKSLTYWHSESTWNAARVSRPFLLSFLPPEKRYGPQTISLVA